MHYCDKNFKNKKALKEAVAAWLANPATASPVTVHNPEVMSGEPETPKNGTVCVGGPHYPEPHRFYATVTLKDGAVIKVK